MGDWRLPLHLTLICGRSDYGKSTFAFRYLLNAPAACRFVFDDQGRDGRRMEEWNMGIRPCWTSHDLEAALATRWVVFNPSRMFPSDLQHKESFPYFCNWVYTACCRAPGKKFFLVNEIDQFQDRETIPPELGKLVLRGREENVELVCCAQRPHLVNFAITGQATEVVSFNVGESVVGTRLDPALVKVGQLGLAPEAVRQLPKGHFISRAKQSGQTLSGKLF